MVQSPTLLDDQPNHNLLELNAKQYAYNCTTRNVPSSLWISMFGKLLQSSPWPMCSARIWLVSVMVRTSLWREAVFTPFLSCARTVKRYLVVGKLWIITIGNDDYLNLQYWHWRSISLSAWHLVQVTDCFKNTLPAVQNRPLAAAWHLEQIIVCWTMIYLYCSVMAHIPPALPRSMNGWESSRSISPPEKVADTRPCVLPRWMSCVGKKHEITIASSHLCITYLRRFCGTPWAAALKMANLTW